MSEELRNPLLKNKQSGQVVELIQSPFTIGRGLGCDYVTENKITSRRHCTLTKTEHGWTLTDLSTNGTLINDITHIKNGEVSGPLEHKDTFNIGEVWEFLTRSDPVEQLERVRYNDSSPAASPSFDENGVSDEVLLNLADQVEQQLQDQPAQESTNQNNLEIDNAETNSTKPSTSGHDPPNKVTSDPSMGDPNKSQLNPSKQQLTVYNPINISTISQQEGSIKGVQVSVSANNLVLNTSNIATEAVISPENSNKKLKIVTTASTSNKNVVTAFIAPSTSDVNNSQATIGPKILQIQKLTPEQIKNLNEFRKIVLLRSSGSSTAKNRSTSVTNVGISPTANVVVPNITQTNLGASNSNSSTNTKAPIIDITHVPIIISDSPMSLSKNAVPQFPIIIGDSPVPIQKRNVKVLNNISSVPIIDLSSSNPIGINTIPVVDLSKSTDANDTSISEPKVINYIPIPATNVPAPVNEVVVETTNFPIETNETCTGNKVHYSQEPGTSKDANKDIKEQNQFEEMEDELLCTICANLFIKTVTLGCSHSFCQYCIDTWKKKKSECPICRNKIASTTRTLVLDNVIEKMVESASEAMKQARKQAIEDREKLEKEIEEKKKEAANQANRRQQTARRGRGRRNNRREPIQRHNSNSNQGNQNNQTNNTRNNNPPIVQAPAPAAFITIADSPSTTSDDDSDDEYDEGWSDQYNNDDWYNGEPGAYYGGYGSCFICGDPGHWANGCPYRS